MSPTPHTRPAARAFGVLLVAAALAACDGGDDGGDDAPGADAAPLPDAGPDDYPAERIGFVNLIEAGPGGSAGWLAVHAEAFDKAEVPLPVRTAVDGDCSVWVRPSLASCDPACSDGFCAAANQCVPWPVKKSAGTITVTGLAAPLVFAPSMFGYAAEPAPADDLFAAGATIGVSAPGADVPGFATAVVAPAPLEAPFQNLTLVDGQDTEVTWTAATPASGRIQLILLVGWHGAPWEAMLLCETADDGAVTLPGALIAALPRASSGLESHPSQLTRFARANVFTPAGPLEVLVGSQQPMYFSH